MSQNTANRGAYYLEDRIVPKLKKQCTDVPCSNPNDQGKCVCVNNWHIQHMIDSNDM